MLTTASTIYHTPSGNIEVKNSAPPADMATFESAFAPKWLVFPDYIFNTTHIVSITKNNAFIFITVDYPSQCTYNIEVKNVNETWKALQEAFANGVKKK